jgi:hypothetical protein
VAAFAKIQDDLKGALSRLLVVQEAYPDLKANGAFHDMQYKSRVRRTGFCVLAVNACFLVDEALLPNDRESSAHVRVTIAFFPAPFVELEAALLTNFGRMN